MKPLVVTLLLCSPLFAQTWSTVPSGYLAAEGEARTGVPGLGPTGTRQYVIGASHLQGLLGREILALALRRDANWQEPSPAATATLVVRIGHAARAPSAVATDFAINLPQPIEVFRGSVAVRASNAGSSPPGWAAPELLEVPFNAPFVYAGGDLAIEIDGQAMTPAGSWWPVDAVEDLVAGTVTNEGQACGPRAGTMGVTATASQHGLVPGGTAVFDFDAQAGNLALLLVGVATHPDPIDLGVLGAPGCMLRVDFFAALPCPVVATGQPALGDMAWARIALPSQSTLLGGQLVAQWLEFGNPVAVSQAMRVRFAGRMPNLDLVTLQRFADLGVEIQPQRAPVFGFRVD